MKKSNEGYSFQGQRSGEQVVVLVNQHTWVLLPVALTWLILIAIIAGSFWIFGASSISSVIVSGAVIFGALYSIYQWYIWNNGIYILTNQRVINIDQVNLFNRLISEAEINRIQEISTEIAGPIHTMLNFGTVKIQTASTTGMMDLENVPDPYNIQQEIVRIQRESTGHSSQGL